MDEFAPIDPGSDLESDGEDLLVFLICFFLVLVLSNFGLKVATLIGFVVVNTKFAELGRLLLVGVVLQLKRAYKRNDKGGFMVTYRRTWRVQGSLALSRGIGDAHLKQWVVVDPDTMTLLIDSLILVL